MLTRRASEDKQPVSDPRVASLLEAAAAPAEPGPVSGEEAALAAFRASSVRADSWRSRMHTPTRPIKTLAVAAISAGLLLTGGFAAAAAGALPGAAQETAHDMLASINVVVPGANEHAAGHADTRGRSADAPAGGEAASADTESDPVPHGQMISNLARSTELEGAEKGKAISEAARSNGQAGQHGPAQAPEQPAAAGGDDARAPEVGTAAEGDGDQNGDHARVATPNDGGTGTADDASTDNGGSSSTRGTGTAGEMSGGRSTAGSGNAPERTASTAPH